MIMITSGKQIFARLIGNFGISFFSPLISGNVAETMFDIGISFQDTVIIAGLSSVFVTGLAMSKELRDWGQRKKITHEHGNESTHEHDSDVSDYDDDLNYISDNNDFKDERLI